MCMMLVSHMVDIYMEEFETNKQVPVFSIVEKRLNNSSLLSFTNRYGNGITMVNVCIFLAYNMFLFRTFGSLHIYTKTVVKNENGI